MRAEQAALTARSAEALVSLCLAAAIILFFSFHYYGYLASTGISPGDEYLTLDRTNAFSVMGDFATVYTGNLPSFAKPPLQYWLGALLIALQGDVFYAIKLPSFIFSVLILLNVYFLTRYLLPDRPIAAVFPPLILTVSGRFWQYSITAMLDSGAAWFALLAVTVLIVALDRPRVWYLWALAVFLGALQKAPVGLAFSAVILGYLALADRQRARASLLEAGHPHFRNAVLLAFVAMAIWPVWQSLQYGVSAVRYGIGEQMLERFNPIGETLFNDFGWINWLIGENGRIFWIPGILFSLFHVFRPREGALAYLSAIAIGFIVAMLIARGKIYDRYILIFYPFVAVILACSVFTLVRNRLLAVPAMLAMFFFNGQFLYDREEVSAASSRVPPFAAQLDRLKRLAAPDKTIMLCRADAPEEPSLSAVSYFASNGAPVVILSDRVAPEKHRAKFAGTHGFVGLCRVRYSDMLRAVFADLSVLEAGEGFVLWSASSVR